MASFWDDIKKSYDAGVDSLGNSIDEAGNYFFGGTESDQELSQPSAISSQDFKPTVRNRNPDGSQSAQVERAINPMMVNPYYIVGLILLVVVAVKVGR